MKKIKLFIKPVLESKDIISFKLKSNVDIGGFQFKMSGFSDGFMYQFEDMGSIKSTMDINKKSLRKWYNMSIVDMYDFTINVNAFSGTILAFNLKGNYIKAGHNHLFSIPIKKNENGKKLEKYCIRELIVSDIFGNKLKRNMGETTECLII